jgi:L-seryl-tRNA(Ser) seleniumtransferase
MLRELLRRLPAVDAWLSSEQGAALCAEYSRAEVVAVMRTHLARIRQELADGVAELPDFASDAYTQLLRTDLLARRTISLRPVINATGIVIHTNLGRAPLAREAIDAVVEISRGYSNLEYDLEDGKRGSRNGHAADLLCRLTGAEAALVVNNCAAAVLLALRVCAGAGEVVISRGELIEIGGSFRMPDVIAQSGATMVEVGTTNRTTVRDYADAITDRTRVLLMSHPSNYRIIGFTASPAPGAVAALAKERGIALVRDLGSGSLIALDELGSAEPTVAECVAAGADLVTFSGDKLLGGPQAGIVVGRADLIQRLRKHPLARACRIDKLSLAALVATLRLYEPPHDPRERVPVLRMIAQSAAAVGDRALRLARELGRLDAVNVEVVDGVSFAGGGASPMSELATKVLRIEELHRSAAELAAKLRAGDPPVVARVFKDALNLDLRTVLPEQEGALIRVLREAFS